MGFSGHLRFTHGLEARSREYREAYDNAQTAPDDDSPVDWAEAYLDIQERLEAAEKFARAYPEDAPALEIAAGRLRARLERLRERRPSEP